MSDDKLPGNLVKAREFVEDGALRALLDYLHGGLTDDVAGVVARTAERPDGWHQLAVMSAALNDATAMLRLIQGTVDAVLVKVMPEDEIDHDQLRCRIERKWSRPDKNWDSAMVVDQLAARLADEMVDRETGEVPPVAEIARRVAKAVADAAGMMTASAEWRTRKLQAHGLDPKRYYSSPTPPVQAVSMPGRVKKRAL